MFQLIKTFSIFFILLFVVFTEKGFSTDQIKYVSSKPSKESFPLASKRKTASLLVSDNDFPGILRIVKHLRADIKNVTNVEPNLFFNKIENVETVVIIGTFGKSPLIDQLAKDGKIDSSALVGKWEKFTTQIIQNLFPGVKQALVIAGSDKRGTIYGIYDLSNQIGVSPWYWYQADGISNGVFSGLRMES